MTGPKMLDERKHNNRLMNALRNFRDDSGSTTVEFVLWVPVFLVILALTVDVSLMFLRQSNIWQVARDTARIYSIRQLNEAQAEAYATAHATLGGDVPTVDVIPDAVGDAYVQVLISVPISDVGLFGILNIGAGSDLIAVVTHRMEPI